MTGWVTVSKKDAKGNEQENLKPAKPDEPTEPSKKPTEPAQPAQPGQAINLVAQTES